MKVNKKRLLIELAATAVVSPVILLFLVLLHAWRVLLILAYPTMPLSEAVSTWILANYPTRGGGWFDGFGETILAEIFILPLWTWLLLMILVRLFDKFKPQREKA